MSLMQLTIGRQRSLGYGGHKHPWRRRLYSGLSRLIARRAGGGLVFLEDDELLVALERELGLDPGPPLAHYLDELLDDAPMERALRRAREQNHPVEDPDWPTRVHRLRGLIAVYYALLRKMRPSVVVETGTAAGSYTSFAAAALHRNEHGRLISIDIPPIAGKYQMDMTVEESSIGYYLPQEYRDRWTYLKGDAKELLPKTLNDERADVFIHDSLHTPSHMLFEYAVARVLMPRGGVIVSDDILWNSAFNAFLATNGLYGYSPYSKPGTGVVVNRFEGAELECARDARNEE